VLLSEQPSVILGVSGEEGRDGTIRPAPTMLRIALALPARDR
jgi:hypothetical protein